MQDRQPTPGQEGRVLITPEDGTASFYAKISMADNPSQEGTLLDKSTFLKDATAAKYELSDDAVPDEVFSLIADSIKTIETNQVNGAKIVTGSYVGTGSDTKTFSFPINVQILFIAETGGGYYRRFAIIQKGASVMSDVNIEPGDSQGNTNAFPCSFNGVTLSSSGSGSPLWFNAASSNYSYVAIGN